MPLQTESRKPSKGYLLAPLVNNKSSVEGEKTAESVLPPITSLPPLLQKLVERSVAREIMAYFPDTTFCHLVRNEGLACASLSDCQPEVQNRGKRCVSAPAAAESKTKSTSLCLPLSSSSSAPVSRKRTLVERLVADAESFITASSSSSSNGNLRYVAGPSLSVNVQCTRCETHLLSSYRCTVLRGYYVVWAESVLQTVVSSSATSTPSCALSMDGMMTRSGSLPTRLVPSEVSKEKTEPQPRRRRLSVDASSSTPVPSSLPSRSTEAVQNASCAGAESHRTPITALCKAEEHPKQKQGNEELGEEEEEEQRYTVTFHSLHIVRDDVLRHQRAASFALQSVLRPGRPIELECYPRHMIHFGLLCYGMWHECSGHGMRAPDTSHALPASRSSLRSSSRRGKPKPASSSTGSSPLLRSSSGLTASSRASTSSSGCVAALDDQLLSVLPLSSSDAVLVLGLGGNVLGTCLDTILPSCVTLDVVEVEPAVLAACLAHGQLPALVHRRETAGSCDTSSNQSMLRKPEPVDTPKVKGKGETPPSASTEPSFAVFHAAHPHPRGTRYRVVLGDAYRFLRFADLSNKRPFLNAACDSAVTTGTVPSLPQTQYSLIFLDCYDPDRETMMHEEAMLELCRRRLQPGGCLLVNVHVLPTAALLTTLFLRHGFASVQVLRVAGCVQCVVACLAYHENDEQSPADDHRDDREQLQAKEKERACASEWFNVANARKLASRINRYHYGAAAHKDVDGAEGIGLRGGIQLDAEWLKSSQHIAPVSPSLGESTDRGESCCEKVGPVEASPRPRPALREGKAAQRKQSGTHSENTPLSDCRLWVHHE